MPCGFRRIDNFVTSSKQNLISYVHYHIPKFINVSRVRVLLTGIDNKWFQFVTSDHVTLLHSNTYFAKYINNNFDPPRIFSKKYLDRGFQNFHAVSRLDFRDKRFKYRERRDSFRTFCDARLSYLPAFLRVISLIPRARFIG